MVMHTCKIYRVHVKIQHLRNATTLVTLGEHVLLVDPMLAEVGTLPGFKQFGPGARTQRNPLVPLPSGTDEALAAVTAVLVTHEHPDHFDQAGLDWTRARGLPVWASPIDAPSLRRKQLDVHELHDGALGMRVELIPAKHGRGLVAWLMGPVAGCYLAHEGEPSLLFTSDAVLTDALLEAVERLQPEVIVAPAGAANFGVGPDILFSVDELVTLIRRTKASVVLDHLEAIDHCPTTRAQLRRRLELEGLAARVYVPEDGEVLHFERDPGRASPQVRASEPRPGLQKWLTAKFAGTRASDGARSSH